MANSLLKMFIMKRRQTEDYVGFLLLSTYDLINILFGTVMAIYAIVIVTKLQIRENTDQCNNFTMAIFIIFIAVLQCIIAIVRMIHISLLCFTIHLFPLRCVNMILKAINTLLLTAITVLLFASNCKTSYPTFFNDVLGFIITCWVLTCFVFVVTAISIIIGAILLVTARVRFIANNGKEPDFVAQYIVMFLITMVAVMPLCAPIAILLFVPVAYLSKLKTNLFSLNGGQAKVVTSLSKLDGTEDSNTPHPSMAGSSEGVDANDHNDELVIENDFEIQKSIRIPHHNRGKKKHRKKSVHGNGTATPSSLTNGRQSVESSGTPASVSTTRSSMEDQSQQELLQGHDKNSVILNDNQYYYARNSLQHQRRDIELQQIKSKK